MSIFDKIADKMLGVGPQKMETAQDQPQPDIELAAFVKSKVEEARSQGVRISHEAVWMTNIAYVVGVDSVFYDPQLRMYRPNNQATGVNRGLNRNRLHSNLIMPSVQNRLARMLKVPPKYEVRPNSMEEEDKEAARLGEEVIDMVWDKQAINRKRIDLGMWTMQCGHAYVKVSFDETLGNPLPAIGPTPVDPMASADVNPNLDAETKYEGDIRVDVVSAFECYADPLAKTLEEASWFAQAKVRKLDYFREQYERGNLVKEEGAWLLSAQYEMRINTLSTAGPASSGSVEQMKNAAIEISYYERRSKKHPKGRHIVVGNGVILKNDELPCGEIPFAKFDDVIVAGKYFSESLITQARPLQDQYNRLLEKRAQWENRLLAGKFIAAKGHGLIQEAGTDQSGEWVEYDPIPNAPPPQAMDIPVMPQYAYTSTADLEKKLYDLFGLSEVSRGQLPSASIPAVGIQLLVEQDETRMGIEIEQHEHSWARVGQLILKFAEMGYKTPRQLKTRGNNLEFKIKGFDGSKLLGNTDVTVKRGSTVPNSKVLKRQEIINLWQQGLLGPMQDPAVVQQVLGQLEYGDVGQSWQPFHITMTQIQDSLREIEQEIPPTVNFLDNHLLHVKKKNEYRIEKGKFLSPAALEILENDIQQHIDMGAKLLNPALMQPPPEPPPPRPDEVLELEAQQGGPVQEQAQRV